MSDLDTDAARLCVQNGWAVCVSRWSREPSVVAVEHAGLALLTPDVHVGTEHAPAGKDSAVLVAVGTKRDRAHEDSGPSPKRVQLEPGSVSAGEPARVVVRPWMATNGELNAPFLRALQLRIVFEAMLHAGLPQDQLLADFRVLPPADVLAVAHEMCRRGVLQRRGLTGSSFDDTEIVYFLQGIPTVETNLMQTE